MVLKIPLNTGLEAIIDEEDCYACRYRWRISTRTDRTCYPRHQFGYNGKTKEVFLHRVIMESILARQLVPGETVDHINGNALDNRRSNLRVATPIQQQYNRKVSSLSKTGFKGVSFEYGKYRARIRKDGEHISIGMFDTPEDAARAYDGAAHELFGEFARLNLPEDRVQIGDDFLIASCIKSHGIDNTVQLWPRCTPFTFKGVGVDDPHFVQSLARLGLIEKVGKVKVHYHQGNGRPRYERHFAWVMTEKFRTFLNKAPGEWA